MILLLALLQAQDVAPETKLRMALVSLKCLTSDTPDPAANRKNIEANLERHRAYIDRATAQGAEFVGFPELSINGYHFSPCMTWLSLDGPEVKAVAAKAVEKKAYVSVGLAEKDADGRKWNTQIVIGPDGKIVGRHHKIWLTAEGGHVERGTSHEVFDVKGVKMGIVTCADGSDFLNLKAVADAGAKIIYGPHANTTGSTLEGWYRFRARWGGTWDGKTVAAKTSNDGPEAQVPSGGWAAHLKVHAALHNHAGLFEPAVPGDAPNRFAAGAWFIGPDGRTLAQQAPSAKKEDSREFLLIQDVVVR
jgi:predicted amidohydrolase